MLSIVQQDHDIEESINAIEMGTSRCDLSSMLCSLLGMLVHHLGIEFQAIKRLVLLDISSEQTLAQPPWILQV